MTRVLLIAVCCISASLGSSYAVAYWTLNRAAPKVDDKPRGLEQHKTRIINVPILAEGQVQGYIVAQFIYAVEPKALGELSAPPDAFILDEAFRMIYGDEKLDSRKLTKLDLAGLTGELKAASRGG